MLLASLAAVALLVLVAWALGFRGAPRLDADSAAHIAAAAEIGFQPRHSLIAADGRAALLRDDAGRLVLVLGVGDGWAVRAVPAAAVVRRDGDIAIRLPLFPRVTLPVPAWL